MLKICALPPLKKFVATPMDTSPEGTDVEDYTQSVEWRPHRLAQREPTR